MDSGLTEWACSFSLHSNTVRRRSVGRLMMTSQETFSLRAGLVYSRRWRLSTWWSSESISIVFARILPPVTVRRGQCTFLRLWQPAPMSSWGMTPWEGLCSLSTMDRLKCWRGFLRPSSYRLAPMPKWSLWTAWSPPSCWTRTNFQCKPSSFKNGGGVM